MGRDILVITLPMFTALIVVFIANYWNDRRVRMQHELELNAAHQRFLREKLEALYVHLQHWRNGLTGTYLAAWAEANGRISAMESNQSFLRQPDGAQDFEHLAIAINLYFPPLRTAYARVVAARDVAGGLMLKCRSVGASRNRPALAPENVRRDFERSTNDVYQAIDMLVSEVVEVSKHLNPGTPKSFTRY